jgi:hypothetical protein
MELPLPPTKMPSPWLITEKIGLAALLSPSKRVHQKSYDVTFSN